MWPESTSAAGPDEGPVGSGRGDKLLHLGPHALGGSFLLPLQARRGEVDDVADVLGESGDHLRRPGGVEAGPQQEGRVGGLSGGSDCLGPGQVTLDELDVVGKPGGHRMSDQSPHVDALVDEAGHDVATHLAGSANHQHRAWGDELIEFRVGLVRHDSTLAVQVWLKSSPDSCHRPAIPGRS